MCMIQVNIPNEVMYDTHMDAVAAAAFAGRMTALGLYVHNHVSIGYCAQIAGMTEEEFMLFLGQNKIDVFCFDSDEELLRDVENA